MDTRAQPSINDLCCLSHIGLFLVQGKGLLLQGSPQPFESDILSGMPAGLKVQNSSILTFYRDPVIGVRKTTIKMTKNIMDKFYDPKIDSP